MADMTNLPFCLMCKQHGAPLVFHEMVSSEAVVRMNQKTLKMAAFDERERPIIQQIFGKDPSVMAEAARIIEEKFHPDGIDINMGCPVYNLVSHFNGASLIKDPSRAAAILKAVKTAVRVPVSVKTRLGWKADTDCLDFVKVLEDAGADLICIHGRTKEQGYSGRANWERVGEARRCVPRVPFLVNGDICSAGDAKRALEQSGADGVMIGRGALGNPWIFREIISGVGAPLVGALGSVPTDGTAAGRAGTRPAPTMTERINAVLSHARLHIEHHGEGGLIQLRKHLPWYFRGMHNMKDLRAKLVRVSTLSDLEHALSYSTISLL